MTAPARAKSLALGSLGDWKECDLVPARPPAAAGGTAVDPGRAHGIHERPVIAAVARQHGAPTLVQHHGGTGEGHALNIGTRAAAIYPFLNGELSSISRRPWDRRSPEPCPPPSAGTPRTGRDGGYDRSTETTARPAGAGRSSAWDR